VGTVFIALADRSGVRAIISGFLVVDPKLPL
jgi:hypothetical protein